MSPMCPSPKRTTPIRAAAALVAAGTGLGLLSFAVGPALAANAATAPASSAQAEYQAALASVKNQGMHFTSTAQQNGVHLTIVGDTGATEGAQKITIDRNGAKESMTAMVVKATGYVNGNKAALHDVIGLTSKQSSKYAGTWLSFPTSSTLGTLVSGLLNKDVATELSVTGPYTYGKKTTQNGQSVLTIKGTASADGGTSVPVVLYVAASGAPKPVKEVTNPTKSGGSTAITGSVSFSNWGEKTTETAPGHTVSLLKLVPTATSGATSTTAG